MRNRTFLILAFSLCLMIFTSIEYSYAQVVIQDPDCRGCIDILPEELDIYRDLFPLTIWTDSKLYDHSSVISVWGHLRPDNFVAPVTITVTNELGSIVTIEQITPPPNGDFVVRLNTSSPLWKYDGMYIIKAQSGSETRLFKTQVELTSQELGDSFVCSSDEIRTPTDTGEAFCLPKFSSTGVDSVETFLNTASKTIEFDLMGVETSQVTVSLPRGILDSQSPEGNDADFIVLFNGNAIPYTEIESSKANHRELMVDLPFAQDGKLEIVGTKVIPEFGGLVMIILICSITMIVIVSRKTNFVIPRF